MKRSFLLIFSHRSNRYDKCVIFAISSCAQRVVICWGRCGPFRSSQDHLRFHPLCGQDLCCSPAGGSIFLLHFVLLRLTYAQKLSASTLTVFTRMASRCCKNRLLSTWDWLFVQSLFVFAIYLNKLLLFCLFWFLLKVEEDHALLQHWVLNFFDLVSLVAVMNSLTSLYFIITNPTAGSWESGFWSPLKESHPKRVRSKFFHGELPWTAAKRPLPTYKPPPPVIDRFQMNEDGKQELWSSLLAMNVLLAGVNL